MIAWAKESGPCCQRLTRSVSHQMATPRLCSALANATYWSPAGTPGPEAGFVDGWALLWTGGGVAVPLAPVEVAVGLLAG
ncbi:hypothetical protein GCM10009744_38740 [Kribbella alba]|uniref:Uncharacterized protein n=1 Tax=Kribbella alba TaxID=190197 RepID=A0ABN2FFE3_9ACTN